jgi:hypothetical protein
VGEPLTIAGQLTDEAGQLVVQVEVRLASSPIGPLSPRGTGRIWPDDRELSLTTDSDGTYHGQVSFPKKGDYSITVRYDGSPGRLPAEASRAILIVDYREEIVRLYNAFLSEVRGRSSLIPEDATPREVEGIMVSRPLALSAGSGQALDEIALDDFISAFEEADYSLHPIERRHYERAYRAYQVLTIGFTVPSVLVEAGDSIGPEVDANKPASTNS